MPAKRSKMMMMGDDKTLKTYLKEIAQTDLLTREQEVELAGEIAKGNEEARQLMIRANLRLVVKIAQGYMGIGLPLLDLISEGNIGLMKAVDRFDPDKGGKLSTYAAWWIKQSIKRALANQSKTIRLPAHLVDKISKMRGHIHRLIEELGREPTNEEIGLEMGVSPGMIAHWRGVSTRPTSLDAPVGDMDGAEFSDIIGDERQLTPFQTMKDRQQSDGVESMMHHLDQREKDILTYRFGLYGHEVETLETVGERFSITRERVRQIQNAAVEKLRALMLDRDKVHTKEGSYSLN